MTLEPADETPAEEVRPDNAPHQRYFDGKWPDRGEYEAVAKLDGIDRSFRTTQRGIEPGSHFGYNGMIHPGRDIIGWFVETIEPDELGEYRDWLEQYGVTVE